MYIIPLSNYSPRRPNAISASSIILFGCRRRRRPKSRRPPGRRARWRRWRLGPWRYNSLIHPIYPDRFRRRGRIGHSFSHIFSPRFFRVAPSGLRVFLEAHRLAPFRLGAILPQAGAKNNPYSHSADSGTAYMPGPKLRQRSPL